LRSVRRALAWIGIVLLGIVNGVLEDLMFYLVMVPYFPRAWDLTGDLLWVFTVPVAQLMALAVTGTLAWFLGIARPARLFTFWACWTAARTAFLTFAHNPLGDILLYLLWIALWCGLIGLLAHFLAKEGAPTVPEGVARD
jgi:hypothetical protein